MNLFNVPTFDQNLSIDERPLTSNNQTLAELRVEPHCIITLKVSNKPHHLLIKMIFKSNFLL